MFRKFFCILLALLIFSRLSLGQCANISRELNLLPSDKLICASNVYEPLLISGIEINPDDPLLFSFLLKNKEKNHDTAQLNKEISKPS